jgi:hypothetical protein
MILRAQLGPILGEGAAACNPHIFFLLYSVWKFLLHPSTKLIYLKMACNKYKLHRYILCLIYNIYPV